MDWDTDPGAAADLLAEGTDLARKRDRENPPSAAETTAADVAAYIGDLADEPEGPILLRVAIIEAALALATFNQRTPSVRRKEGP